MNFCTALSKQCCQRSKLKLLFKIYIYSGFRDIILLKFKVQANFHARQSFSPTYISSHTYWTFRVDLAKFDTLFINSTPRTRPATPSVYPRERAKIFARILCRSRAKPQAPWRVANNQPDTLLRRRRTVKLTQTSIASSDVTLSKESNLDSCATFSPHRRHNYEFCVYIFASARLVCGDAPQSTIYLWYVWLVITFQTALYIACGRSFQGKDGVDINKSERSLEGKSEVKRVLCNNLIKHSRLLR